MKYPLRFSFKIQKYFANICYFLFLVKRVYHIIIFPFLYILTYLFELSVWFYVKIKKFRVIKNSSKRFRVSINFMIFFIAFTNILLLINNLFYFFCKDSFMILILFHIIELWRSHWLHCWVWLICIHTYFRNFHF